MNQTFEKPEPSYTVMPVHWTWHGGNTDSKMAARDHADCPRCLPRR